MKRIADYLAEIDFSAELFESLQLGMLIVKPDWTVTAWSEVLETWTEISADSVLGKKLTDRYPHLKTSHVAIQLESVLNTGRPAILRPPLVPHLLPISARGESANLPMMQETRIHRISSEPRQALIILRDVTAEQVQREAFHREHDQFISLQQQLHDASAALREATASAVQESEAKSELLANLSHEIRCLMTPILAYTDLLADDPSPANVHTALGTIRRNGEHLLGMLDDVLDLSRLDAGKISLNLEATDPRQIVKDVVTMTRTRADEKGLSITMQCYGALPFSVQTDPVRVRQVLLNLISNAIKFTQTGGIIIRIQLANQDPSCRQLAFDVVDTGSGLAPDQVEHLFQPFAHTQDNGIAADHGAGLGLTISRNLAQMLGGNIAVTSTGPQGSTFRFTVATGSLEGVPLLEHDDVSELPDMNGQSLSGPTLHVQDPAQETRPHSRYKRLLVAEDAHENRRLMCTLLQETGAEVTLVENGVAAVEEVITAIEADRPYDLILMDEHLPLMDGQHVVAQLREAGLTTPIVAMSSAAALAEGSSGLPIGCNALLTKPLDHDELIDTVHRFTADHNVAMTNER